MSDRWQYKVEEVKGSVWGTIRPADIEERLRVLGAQGWELVNAAHPGQWAPTLLFLKRRG